MITVEKVQYGIQDGISLLKNEIRFREKEKLITLFVIGFIFYQYVPVSAVAGYFVGGLVTTLVYLTAISMITFTYLHQTYGLNSMTIFHFWTSLEEVRKTKEANEIDALKKKAEVLDKAINEKEDEIKEFEREIKRKALEELKKEEEVKKKEELKKEKEEEERRRKEIDEKDQEAERILSVSTSRTQDMVKKEVERIKESERNQKVRKVTCELDTVSCKCNKKRLDRFGVIVN